MKPKATDQSLLTYRKKQTPNVTQILPLSVPSCQNATGTGRCKSLSVLHGSEKRTSNRSPLEKFCLHHCVVFPDG